MAAAIDLDAYLDRIGYEGALAPTADVLAALVRAHVSRVPFENLDVLLGRGVRLDLPALEDKLVRRRRGGYCFEHTTLFAAVLARIGFTCRAHSARVLVHRARELAPRTHMFLTVPVEGRTYVVDPGYGQAARVPLPLEEGTVSRDGHEVHRLIRDGEDWVVARGEPPERQWIGSLAEDLPVDFEVANHYTATFPASTFVRTVMLRAWLADGRRVGVFNREATIWIGERAERATLPDRSALRRFVADHLGFDLPEIERMIVPGVPEWAG